MSTPLTSPRQIPCSDCRARTFTACKRVKAGRKVQVEYMKGFHAARRAQFKRILAANPDATTDPATWGTEAAS